MTLPTPHTVLPLLLALMSVVTPAAAQHPDIQAEVHGMVLLNAFANSDAVNNSDVPQFVLPPPPPGGLPPSGAGATMRQSRVEVRASVAEFAGGRLAGELDVDFFGGQQPSTGGRTFPLIRLRRAFAEFTRGRLAVFAGQGKPRRKSSR
jgi:hypothetical protein